MKTLPLRDFTKYFDGLSPAEKYRVESKLIQNIRRIWILCLCLAAWQVHGQTSPNASRACGAPAGMDQLHGLIYQDNNSNSIYDAGDVVYSNATVNLYEDANQNGSPDGGILKTITSDVSGEYQFDTTLLFPSTASYDQRVQNDADDAWEQGGDVKEYENKARVGRPSDNAIAGFRFTGLNIPAGAVIDSAFLYTSNNNNANKDNYIDVFAEDIANPLSFSDANPISTRTLTSTSVEYYMDWLALEVDDKSPDVRTVIQELVDSYNGIDAVAFILKHNTNSDNTRMNIKVVDNTPDRAVRLQVYYSTPGQSYTFLSEVDVASLPAGSSLTSPTYQTATFTATDQADCGNDFGFEVGGPCTDGSTTEPNPSFGWGSEWKYDDSGNDLGTAWTSNSFDDACWNYGLAELGFGDGDENTVISNHGGITYYFRKHFTVSDVTLINNLFMDLRRDDGIIIYLNGTEVYRSNMPLGPVNYLTRAASNQSGGEESAVHSILLPASLLTNGNNVISAEVHQDRPTSSDITFDLRLNAETINQVGGVLIGPNNRWNYNDNGTDLGTNWREESIQENRNEWEAGNTELGYGDGDENTVISYGPNSSDKYPTYYFRHYFSTYDFNNYDSLWVKLRRDDGAVVYLNGTEIMRSNMPTGTISYNTNAVSAIGGSGEDIYQTISAPASLLNSGSNVIAVEIHQSSGTSSDVSFELELELYPGDPSTFNASFDELSGRVFLDIDVDRSFSAADIGQGALEVWAYQDVNQNGEIDPASDPRLFGDLSSANGDFEISVYEPGVESRKCDVVAAADDAVEDISTGTISLNDPVLKSINFSVFPTRIIDTASIWKYDDNGNRSGDSWKQIGFDDSGWSSGLSSLGFGDAANTTINNHGSISYYFRKTVALGGLAPFLNTAIISLKRDDGAVIYINGVEVYRNNMPSGAITGTTPAASKIQGSEEDNYIEVQISNPGFLNGTNVIAVEIHQDGPTSSDVMFDMSLMGANSSIDDVALRFDQLDVPQGAQIIDAHIRMYSAELTEAQATIQVVGEASDDASGFTSTAFSISSRPRTGASTLWNSSHPFVNERDNKIDNLQQIVQEIVDRPGWSAGNAMAFFLSGYEREFYTHEGGFPAELTISYVDTTQQSIDYVLGIDPIDLPEYYNYMTDGSPSATLSTSGRPVSGLNIGYIGNSSMCIATSDDLFDSFHIINRFSGKNKTIGSTGSGDMQIESVCLSLNADTIYTVDNGDFGTIDPATGIFSPYGNSIGIASGSLGNINLDDIDGLTFDVTRNIIWASHRRSSPQDDLIFIIDRSTGLFVPDPFGNGNDYIVATGAGLLPDIDDIAINPNTGNLFAMNNDNGNITLLTEIDVSNGTANVIGTTSLNDMEGQGFHNDGLYYTTSGREGIPDNSFYQVDTATAALTFIGFFESGGDFEGCDCKSGPAVNFLDGYVFNDVDEDGLLGGSDIPDDSVTIYIYDDLNGDGILDPGEPAIDSTMTNSDGYFAFGILQKGVILTTINTADLPPDAEFTTSSNYNERFLVSGGVSPGNNFGYRYSGALPVELVAFTGETAGSENHLFWTTASEINSDVFLVQRSLEGLDFETIGTVDGARFSTTELNYSFIDEFPANGINYYRLKQVDFDGSVDYSRIISLSNTITTSSEVRLKTWPTITDGPVQMLVEGVGANQAFRLAVYNMAGHLVLEYLMAGESSSGIEIDLSPFGEGIYLIELNNSNYQFSRKVVVH